MGHVAPGPAGQALDGQFLLHVVAHHLETGQRVIPVLLISWRVGEGLPLLAAVQEELGHHPAHHQQGQDGDEDYMIARQASRVGGGGGVDVGVGGHEAEVHFQDAGVADAIELVLDPQPVVDGLLGGEVGVQLGDYVVLGQDGDVGDSEAGPGEGDLRIG